MHVEVCNLLHQCGFLAFLRTYMRVCFTLVVCALGFAFYVLPCNVPQLVYRVALVLGLC